jgi:CheY-like chemotaxis protein
MTVAERPRILILGQTGPAGTDWLQEHRGDGEQVRVESWARALEALRSQQFDLVVGSPSDPAIHAVFQNFVQAERILATLPSGVAVVDFDLRIRWANPVFEQWTGGLASGRSFYEALGAKQGTDSEFCPFHSALASSPPGPVICRLSCLNNRQLELHITPLPDSGPVAAGTGRRGPTGTMSDEPRPARPLLLVVCRDVTQLVLQQQEIEALHQAGRALADLPAEQLAEMSSAERIEFLKQNIRRTIHDVLHYDVIAIRLVDPETGRLVTLLQEGMAPETANRTLAVSTEGNGVTGYVAATRRSYVCSDTSLEPLYLTGAPGARSSLTVPLLYHDQLIGTLNVESPRLNAFGPTDVQFAEVFAREVASALHTLELLTVEKRSTATQSVEAISTEVALPVDEILAAATSVLDRYIGHEPDMADKLRKILTSARAIKQSIQKVGENLAPAVRPQPNKPPPPACLKSLRVLVADSDERVRLSAHSILGRWGCIVETARDGQEALTLARLSTYDAILADIRLPDIGGYEIYRQLRQAQPQARVILMTGYGYDPTHTLVKARQEGLRHVLYKPFRVDQLLNALATPAAPPEGSRAPDGAPAAPGRCD